MRKRVLVTGASGYIGGRLIPALLEEHTTTDDTSTPADGFVVRAMARRVESLHSRHWATPERLASGTLELCHGDALDLASLTEAMADVDVAYYLMHSMNDGPDYAERERVSARNFVEAAKGAGVSRIVYLSGLHPESSELSPHLASRVEVGKILLESSIPTVVLQAAVILGSGSASFEMMRYLAERLPAMIAPRWVTKSIQPIGVRDVLWYLRHCAGLPSHINRAFDIGGPSILTYRDMMHEYARIVGLPKRRIVTVPVLTPRLASHWIGFVTPVPPAIAKPLVGSMIHDVVMRECDIDEVIPPPPDGLMSFERATRHALQRIADGQVFTSFANAHGAAAAATPMPEDPSWAGGDVFVDEYSTRADAPPSNLWRVIEGIGGQHGWYSWKVLWQIRGIMDRAVGGPGLRRGRNHPHQLRVGDPVDWWRVEHIETGRALRLRAEMKLPGKAWLELTAVPTGDASSRTSVLGVRAIFEPRGVWGRAYWFAVTPFHGFIFGTMCRRISHTSQHLK